METPQKPGGNLLLLNALLELLNLKDNEKVRTEVRAFRELLKGIDPFSSFKLLRLKLKSLVAMRDAALLGGVRQKEAKPSLPSTTLKEPIDDMLERALSLLEGASNSGGDFSQTLNQAIMELKRAKDMVTLNKLSKHLMETSSGMAEATSLFQSNIGDLAFAMLDYQRKIKDLEQEVEHHKQVSRIDPLTKINNRGQFDFLFKETVSHALRFRAPLCLLLLDVDNFKQINDQYGHKAGDDVLANLAQLMTRTLGEGTLVFRYGGDEFAALFINMNPTQAQEACKKMEHFITAHEYRYKEHSFPMTVSGGLTALNLDEKRGDFFTRADQLLYKAKEQGRARICLG